MDAYRATYLNEPQGGEERRHSPTKRETLRTQKIYKVDASPGIQTFRKGPAGGGASKMTSSLDSWRAGSIGNQPASQRFLETSGSVRQLPTNVADNSNMVNVNHLRATRQPAIWENYYNGVRTYNVKNLTGNYNEERFDLAFLDGNGTTMAKRNYETTNVATNKEATPGYTKKLDLERMYAKQPEKEKDHRSIYRNSTDFIHNARAPDHTLNSTKKGCFWVGTGNVDRFTTTNSVAYGQKAKHEYQTRNPRDDGKSRMLTGIKPNHQPDPKELSDYRTRWTKHEGAVTHERSHQSEYKGRFSTLQPLTLTS